MGAAFLGMVKVPVAEVRRRLAAEAEGGCCASCFCFCFCREGRIEGMCCGSRGGHAPLPAHPPNAYVLLSLRRC